MCDRRLQDHLQPSAREFYIKLYFELKDSKVLKETRLALLSVWFPRSKKEKINKIQIFQGEKIQSLDIKTKPSPTPSIYIPSETPGTCGQYLTWETILQTKWFFPLTPATQHISKFRVEFYNSKWIFKVLVSSQQFIKSYNYAKETLELENIKIFYDLILVQYKCKLF